MPLEELKPSDEPESAANDPAFYALLREVAEVPRLPPELMRTITFDQERPIDVPVSPFARRLPGLGEIIDGRYLIQNELGRGGMGVVFGARNMRTQREVALKWMLPRGLTRSPAERHESVERFVREARAVSRVDHPNVVRVLDVGGDPEMPYLVMERLEGESLRTRLARSVLSWDEALSLLSPVLEGVSAAHRAGVIHRDLKPDNIFLCASSVVKVLDFGVSRMGGEENHTTLTRTGTMLGTPAYMPLEQLRGSREVDERTDVYALGVILYEALSGRLPFEAQTPADQAVLLATGSPENLADLRPELRGARSDAVMKALARKPADRYLSVEAMRLALAQAPASAGAKHVGVRVAIALVIILCLAVALSWQRAPSIRPDATITPRQTANMPPSPAPPIARVPETVDDMAPGQPTPSALVPRPSGLPEGELATPTTKGASPSARTLPPAARDGQRGPLSDVMREKPLAPLQTPEAQAREASPTSLSVEQFRAAEVNGQSAPRASDPQPSSVSGRAKPAPSLNPSEF